MVFHVIYCSGTTSASVCVLPSYLHATCYMLLGGLSLAGGLTLSISVAHAVRVFIAGMSPQGLRLQKVIAE